MREDQVLPFLKEKGKNPEELDRYFADIHRNPSKAVLLYYLNSGHGRFQQHKEFDANCRGKDFDIDDLCEEIEAEQLDGDELYNLCERFFAHHSFTDNSLWSCGMCGLRELQSKEVAHESKLFKRITLSDLEEDQDEVIRYTEEQREDLEELMKKEIFRVPANENGELVEVRLGEARSYYQHRVDDEIVIYHLHRELVDEDANGNVGTWLCPTCHKCLMSERENTSFVDCSWS